MLKKSKKSLLLASGLAGALITSTAAGVALSSCTTTSSSSNNNSSYSYVIDWNDRALVNRLVVDENGLVYSDSSKTTIIALSPNVQLTNITIPATVKHITGYSRVGIDSSGNKTYTSTGAFQGMDSLISVSLAAGTQLVSIGDNAFYNCANLMSISGDTSNVQVIGASAFYGCGQLQSINLAGVQTIGANAFYNCTTLSGTFDLSNTLIVGENAFYGAFSATNDTTVTLSNVISIGASAFYQSNVTSVSIGSSTAATTIGVSAFSGCAKLTTLTFTSSSSSNLITIGNTAFQNCTALTAVELNGVSSIGNSAFAGCTKLVTVTLPSNENSVLTTIGASAFSGDTLLTTVAPAAATGSTSTGFVSTKSMTTIGASAFADTAITSIDTTNFTGTTSSGVTTTGSATSFAGIPNLTSVIIGSSITRLDASSGQGLFYGSGLSGDGFDIALPSSITGINVSGGASAFTNSGVKTIDLSKITSYWTNNNNTVLTNTYNGLTKLEKIILRPGTTTIQATAFSNVPALKTVVIPSTSTEDVSSVAGFKASETLTTINTGNFVTTSLATIDLTSVPTASISTITNTSGIFTNLPTGAVVKLPATATSALNSGSFTIAKTDSAAATTYASVQYPNGVTIPTANITSGTLSGATFLNNVSGSLDLTSNTTINSIGQNTFFGSGLTSLSLPGSAIESSTNLFSTTATITTGTSNTTTPASYVLASVPFGNNAALTALNYSSFVASTTDTPTTARTAQSLFESTTQDTWTKVAKIINSLSNYTYVDGDASDSASKLPINLSAWTAATSGQTKTTTVLADSVATLTAATTGENATAANVAFTNSFGSADSTLGPVTITATDTSVSFVHNGITWTYTNDGSTIKLTGEANMYKLSGSSSSYLTFFNTDQVQYQPSSGSAVTYNIPSQTKVAVTLTIATA